MRHRRAGPHRRPGSPRAGAGLSQQPIRPADRRIRGPGSAEAGSRPLQRDRSEPLRRANRSCWYPGPGRCAAGLAPPCDGGDPGPRPTERSPTSTAGQLTVARLNLAKVGLQKVSRHFTPPRSRLRQRQHAVVHPSTPFKSVAEVGPPRSASLINGATAPGRRRTRTICRAHTSRAVPREPAARPVQAAARDDELMGARSRSCFRRLGRVGGVKSGKTGRLGDLVQRSAAFPDVPTWTRSGEGFDATAGMTDRARRLPKEVSPRLTPGCEGGRDKSMLERNQRDRLQTRNSRRHSGGEDQTVKPSGAAG